MLTFTFFRYDGHFHFLTISWQMEMDGSIVADICQYGKFHFLRSYFQMLSLFSKFVFKVNFYFFTPGLNVCWELPTRLWYISAPLPQVVQPYFKSIIDGCQKCIKKSSDTTLEEVEPLVWPAPIFFQWPTNTFLRSRGKGKICCVESHLNLENGDFLSHN